MWALYGTTQLQVSQIKNAQWAQLQRDADSRAFKIFA